MKKLMLVLLCLAVFATLAAAQNFTSGTSTINGVDVLGAHNNWGRGCAGCHAPHNGAKGGGGNAGVNGVAFNDPYSGADALFGQDLTPLYGFTFSMGDNGRYSETIPAFTYGDGEIRGIAMCLACHDGNIAKGGMMKNASYEQSQGLLPANLYGSNTIPTLLGTNAVTGYQSTHPVGAMATLGAVGLTGNNNLKYGNPTPMTVTFNGTAVQTIAPTASSYYANFAADYGFPAVAGSPWGFGVENPAGNTDASKLFITCTTCHNQHSMYVYKSVGSKVRGGVATTNGITDTGTYPTYFFINGPYNLNTGAYTTPTKAPSTTQFCRQCHVNEENEYFGVNIPTLF